MTNRSAGAGRDGSRLRQLAYEGANFLHNWAIQNFADTLHTRPARECPHPDCVLVRLAVPDPLASQTGQGVCKTCRGSGFVAYWDGGALAGEGCPDCLDHPEMVDGPPAGFTVAGWTLARYGEHRTGCKAGPTATKRHSLCTCGLSGEIDRLNASAPLASSSAPQGETGRSFVPVENGWEK